MLRVSRILPALLLGLGIAGCDAMQTPPSAAPQPQPASMPYQPTRVESDTTIQLASVPGQVAR
jgi:hypothetical protein